MPSRASIRYIDLLSPFLASPDERSNMIECFIIHKLRCIDTYFPDTTQIQEFWKKLAWPDLPGSYNFVLKVVDVSDYRNRPCRFTLSFITTLAWKVSTNLLGQLRVLVSNFLNANTCYNNSGMFTSVVRHIIIDLRINAMFDIRWLYKYIR